MLQEQGCLYSVKRLFPLAMLVWYRTVDLNMNCRKEVNVFITISVSLKRNMLLLCSKLTFLMMEIETVMFS